MQIDVTHYVNLELQPLVEPLRQVIEGGLLTRDTLTVLRSSVPTFLPPSQPAPSWGWHTIPSVPDVRVLLVNSKRGFTRLRPAIVHLHGGGFVMGGAQHSLWRTQELAQALDCLVVSVEYRLAPETIFPGALEDSYAALKWLYNTAEALGVDRERIAVVGESAGGGHAAMLAIVARDRGEFPLAFQGLIYPMLDDRTGSVVRKPPYMGALLWNEQRNRFGWSSFLGNVAGAEHAPHGAVPARISDLRGLPPAWIGVGSIDLFVDEDIHYATRLIDAGVPTRLSVVPGAFHVFDAFGDFVIARNFRDDLISSLRVALG